MPQRGLHTPEPTRQSARFMGRAIPPGMNDSIFPQPVLRVC